MLEELATDWRELVAGSEGFLTGEGRRGLWRHEVCWGDMDSMVCLNFKVLPEIRAYAKTKMCRVRWSPIQDLQNEL
jgi:hypothetical protein